MRIEMVKRTIAVAMLFMASLMFSLHTEAQEPELGAVPKDPIYVDQFALIIAINDYKFLPITQDLHFSENDAWGMYWLLIDHYGYKKKNVTILVGKHATKRAIEKALAKLADNRIERDSSVLVHYAGHGKTILLRNGTKMGYIIPYDADVDLTETNPAQFLDQCISMSKFKEISQFMPSKHFLCLMDACYSGLAIEVQRGIEDMPVYLTKVANLFVRAIMTAGMGGERAQARDGHGVFTRIILDALRYEKADLNGDGFTTSRELATYVGQKVQEVTSGMQNPLFGRFDGGPGEFIFQKVSDDESTQQEDKPLATSRDLVLTNNTQPIIDKGGQGEQININDLPDKVVHENPPAKPVVSPNASSMQLIGGLTSSGGTSSTPSFPRPKMVKIQGSEFPMGVIGSPDEYTAVDVQTFYIGVFEVTNEQYNVFVDETGHAPAPFANHPLYNNKNQPVVGLPFNDAIAYCIWLGKRLGKTVMLPTEAQYEKAARGGKVMKRFPWGDNWDRLRLNVSGAIQQVGIMTTDNGFGLDNVVGNVEEWCLDVHGDPSETTYKVVRGGNYEGNEFTTQVTSRRLIDPLRFTEEGQEVAAAHPEHVGFRVVILV